MMMFVSGATKTIRRLREAAEARPYIGRLGRLMRPGNGNLPDDLPWGCDNAAFTGFDEPRFRKMLDRMVLFPGCSWVACPDVVGDATASLAQFRVWEPRLHAMGFPVALVSQDGLTIAATPWESFECLFVGGSDSHKLGGEAQSLAREAKRLGKSVHVGRVNSIARMTYCRSIGADSFDGLQWSKWSDRWLLWGLKHLDTIERSLFV